MTAAYATPYLHTRHPPKKIKRERVLHSGSKAALHSENIVPSPQSSGFRTAEPT